MTTATNNETLLEWHSAAQGAICDMFAGAARESNCPVEQIQLLNDLLQKTTGRVADVCDALLEERMEAAPARED